ncbi:MAG: T9SS type A sorting domain-containing protein [Flavobacteriaceae bacterium]
MEGVTANSVRVYALSGAKVAQYDNPGNTIALGDLSSGLYIASVLSEHGTKAVKFVK